MAGRDLPWSSDRLDQPVRGAAVAAALSGGLLLRLHRLSLWPVVLAAILLLALLRVEATGPPLPLLTVEDQQRVTLRGTISNDPEAAPRSVEFTFAVEAVDRGGGMEPIEATVLAYRRASKLSGIQPKTPILSLQRRLVDEGLLRRPKELADFDYPSYLASHGISGIMHASSSTVLDPEAKAKGGWRGWIFSLRRELSENIEDALPVPQSAVAKALLLGQRGQLPEELKQDFATPALPTFWRFRVCTWEP